MIRLLLALSVLLDHSRFEQAFGFTAIIGGPLAVQAFFMISGFYIGLILDTRYHDVRLFWSNRFLRIFPSYLLIVVLTLCFVVLFDRGWFAQWTHLGLFNGLLMAASTILLLGQDMWMFTGIKAHELYWTAHFVTSTPPLYIFLLVPQAWSLSLELYFYLLAPFLAKLRSAYLLAFIVVLLAARFGFYYFTGLNGDPWSYRFFPFELVMFLLGIVAYRIYRRRQHDHGADRLLYLGVLVATLFFPAWSKLLPSMVSAGWMELAMIFLALPSIFLLTRSGQRDRLLGELSYPLYVCHILCAKLVAQLGLFPGAFGSTVAMVAMSIGVSWLILKYIDAPMSRLRARRVTQ
jgi:peptidoglycan/LPS O-acetylase OafA/YrhL